MSDEDRLEELTRRLREAAQRLRDDELERDAAVALAEECARLAGEAAVELDRRARAAAGEA